MTNEMIERLTTKYVTNAYRIGEPATNGIPSSATGVISFF